MNQIATDVACIGAGIAGWCCAQEVARRGISCIVVDTNPPGGFASTRNQGWLHQGALYQVGDRPNSLLTNYCRQGYQLIMKHYRNVVRYETPALYQFLHKEKRDEFIERCHQAGIGALSVPMRIVERREQLLRGSRLRYIAQVSEHPIDTSGLLQIMADEACGLGTRFVPVSSLDNIRSIFDGTQWRLFLDPDYVICCKIVVLTCGAAIPEMCERLVPEQVIETFTRTKTPVLTLRSENPIAGSLLLVGERAGLHLVPFRLGSEYGAAVCFIGSDRPTVDHRDFELLSDWQERFAQSLLDYCPGIDSLLLNRSIYASVHICQKLHLEGDIRQPFYLSCSPQSGAPENVLVAYPVKFTCGPTLAIMCADKVEELLGNTQSGALLKALPAPRVIKQRCLSDPQYQLVSNSGRLSFKPRYT